MKYLNSKGIGRGHPEKVASERPCSDTDWVAMLRCVEETKNINPKWFRDYAILYLACQLGMRRLEVALLKREHFRDLDHDVVHLPTVKKSEKIQVQCNNGSCTRKIRVKSSRAGKLVRCPKCGMDIQVPDKVGLRTGPIEMPIDIISEDDVGVIEQYLETMRQDQEWLFEGRKGYHISAGYINKIFNTYANLAGCDPKLSFHSLRHNRGQRLYALNRDVVMVRDGLRHSGLSAANFYAHIDVERKKEIKQGLKRSGFMPLRKDG